MRRWLLLGIAVLSFGSCEMAFRNSLFDGIDPVVPLDSAKLGSMTLEQVKNSLGPSLYKGLRADANALAALTTNLENQYSTLTDAASRREAARLVVLVQMNSTVVADILYKAPTTILPILSTLSTTPADVQSAFHKMLGGLTATAAKLKEFYDTMAKIVANLKNLNTLMGDPDGFDAPDLVEFYGDANPGDLAQAGLLGAYFQGLDLATGAPEGSSEALFSAFYFSDPAALTGYNPAILGPNFSAIQGFVSSSTTIPVTKLKFFTQICKKLPL